MPQESLDINGIDYEQLRNWLQDWLRKHKREQTIRELLKGISIPTPPPEGSRQLLPDIDWGGFDFPGKPTGDVLTDPRVAPQPDQLPDGSERIIKLLEPKLLKDKWIFDPFIKDSLPHWTRAREAVTDPSGIDYVAEAQARNRAEEHRLQRD